MMEDESRIKLIIIGFLLAAIVVGYFLLSNRFNRSQVSPQTTTPIPEAVIKTSPTPPPSPSPLRIISSPQPVATRSGLTTKGGLTTSLPKTAFESSLLGLFSISAIIAGWFLRKYPQ